LLIGWLGGSAGGPAFGAEEPAAASVSFAREIRPILSNRCFTCHGPDEKKREADLRLDQREAAFADRGGYASIVPGDPEASELLRRVISQDPDEQMPPPDSEIKPLSAAEQELLRQWIAAGAEWEGHWAYVPPVRPPLPELEDASGVGNEIDLFVRAALRRQKLQPSPEAPKETLIRRVTFDLTGLPPTPAEVGAFLADESPEAYERLVDRLLKSPRYGEHLTRYWLDIARYGDTHGLHLDNVRSIWKYRDWLIDAFNTNMPFDQMTIEQLAGDLLPEATVSQRVATGFNRCNVSTNEGGSIEEEVYVRNTVDRVETFANVYLGLTLGCTVCHDHKYDPFKQREFYGLFAFFNSLEEKAMDGNALLPPPFIEVPSHEQQTLRSGLQSKLDAVRQELDAQLAAMDYVDPHADATAVSLPRQDVVWIDDQTPSQAQQHHDGHPWEFVTAPHPVFSGTMASRRTAGGMGQHFFTGADPPLIVGDADTLFASVYLDPADPPDQIMLQWNDGTWEHRAYWGHNLLEWGQDGTPSRKKRGELPAVGEWVRLEVPVSEVGLAGGAKLHGWAFSQYGGTVLWDAAGIHTRTPQEGQTFESQRQWELAVGDGKDLPAPVQEALKVPPGQRSEQQQSTIRHHFLESVYARTRDLLAPLVTRRQGLQRELDALNEAIPKTMVAEEMATPREAFFLNRGEYDNKGEVVERHLPAALPPLPDGAPMNRLGLARWLVDPGHPLMARVTVNRWWQRCFGNGLVKTAEDFGVQGEPPSHPELLDWLATELIRTGWDVKQMQKLVVMSSTYRQDARVTPQLARRDPENRWLARGPRFRLDAEMIRDQALFVSGLLVETIGGPSVKPYQPEGLWEAVGYTDSNTAKFAQDDGPALYRRSMYTFWKRTAPPPSMSTFDAPSREACVVKRSRTNTPLQALALMNDRQFTEASRHLAQRILREGGASADERLAWAFRLVTSRTPQPAERVVLRALLTDATAEFTANPESASKLIDSASTRLTPDHLARDRSGDVELAAWIMLANLLLNLDEVVSKG
jgi:hypothetical protein